MKPAKNSNEALPQIDEILATANSYSIFSPVAGPGSAGILAGHLLAPRIALVLLAALTFPTIAPGASSPHLLRISKVQAYSGMCDASAAVALDAHRFIVANDEDNILRLYDSRLPGPPVQTFDFTSALRLDRSSPEVDIEGAARINNRIYWISSHGRNKQGELRVSRRRFFATDISAQNGKIQLTLVGNRDRNLFQDLINSPVLSVFNLRKASQSEPKAEGALNIEGICGTPENKLLVGFRNPIPRDRALVVPLRNPEEVIQGKPARFGPVILLDLDGHGIRDMAFANQQYWIIGGSADGSGKSVLYQWAGPGAVPIKFRVPDLKDYNPEAIVLYPPDSPSPLQLLSDDGTRRKSKVPCKELRNPADRTFRALLF